MDETAGQFRPAVPKAMDLSRGVVLAGAAEQMFFFGAPLAHVVSYEQWRRYERMRDTYRRGARAARGTGLELPPLPAGSARL